MGSFRHEDAFHQSVNFPANLSLRSILVGFAIESQQPNNESFCHESFLTAMPLDNANKDRPPLGRAYGAASFHFLAI